MAAARAASLLGSLHFCMVPYDRNALLPRLPTIEWQALTGGPYRSTRGFFFPPLRRTSAFFALFVAGLAADMPRGGSFGNRRAASLLGLHHFCMVPCHLNTILLRRPPAIERQALAGGPPCPTRGFFPPIRQALATSFALFAIGYAAEISRGDLLFGNRRSSRRMHLP